MIKELLSRILRIFRRGKKQRTVTEAPEFKYVRRPRYRTDTIIRYRVRHLPKPGSKASRQDLSKFFKGKGKYAPWYRKQIKRKVKIEEDEL